MTATTAISKNSGSETSSICRRSTLSRINDGVTSALSKTIRFSPCSVCAICAQVNTW